MDAITDFKTILAQAAITPDKPLYAVLLTLHNAGLALDTKLDEVSDTPAEVVRANVAVVEQMKAIVQSAEKLANRPMLTANQVRYDLAPVLLAAVNAATAIIGIVLLAAAFGIGYGLHSWQTPHHDCQDERGGVVCYYWLHPPAQPVPETVPPASAAPLKSPPTRGGHA